MTMMHIQIYLEWIYDISLKEHETLLFLPVSDLVYLITNKKILKVELEVTAMPSSISLYGAKEKSLSFVPVFVILCALLRIDIWTT